MHKAQEHISNLKNFLINVGELFQKLYVNYSKIGEPYFAYARKDGKKTYSIALYLHNDLVNIHKFCNNAGFYHHKRKKEQMRKIFRKVRHKFKYESMKIAAYKVAKELPSEYGWGRIRIARELHKTGYTIQASTVDGWIREKRQRKPQLAYLTT